MHPYLLKLTQDEKLKESIIIYLEKKAIYDKSIEDKLPYHITNELDTALIALRRPIIEPIRLALVDYNDRTFNDFGLAYDFIENLSEKLETLIKLRVLKNNLVKAQSYEESAKVRDKEKTLIATEPLASLVNTINAQSKSKMAACLNPFDLFVHGNIIQTYLYDVLCFGAYQTNRDLYYLASSWTYWEIKRYHGLCTEVEYQDWQIIKERDKREFITRILIR
jgi:hypothetical protein